MPRTLFFLTLGLASALSACGGRSSLLLLDSFAGTPPSKTTLDSGTQSSPDGSACAPDICPVILASGQRHPYGIAVSGSTIFWTNDSDDPGGSVARVPVGGGSIVTLAKTVGRARGIAADAKSVYWSDSGTSAEADDGSVMSEPVGGGATTALATGRLYPTSVAVDGPMLYWASSMSGESDAGAPSTDGFDGVILYGLHAGTPIAVPPTGLPGNASLRTQGIAALDGATFLATTLSEDGYSGAILGGALVSGQTPTSVAVVAADAYGTLHGTTHASGSVVSVHGLTDGTTRAPVTLAQHQNNPDGVAVDSSGVYWTTGSADVADGTVEWLAPGATKSVTLATHQSAPHRIALDGTNVYWTNRGLGAADGSVMQLAKRTACAGGTCACPVADCGACGQSCEGSASGLAICAVGRCIETLSSGWGVPGTLSLASGLVYWTDQDDGEGFVLSFPPSGGAPSTLSTNTESNYMLADANGAFWISGIPSVNGTTGVLVSAPGHAQAMALDATYVYYLDPTVPAIERVPRAFGTSTVLVEGSVNGGPLVVDASSIYWSSVTDSTVNVCGPADEPSKPPCVTALYEAPLAGGPPQLLATLGLASPTAMALDANSLYWVDAAAGALEMIPLAGGNTPLTLASGLGAPACVALDATHAYVGASVGIVKVSLGGGSPELLAPWAGGVQSIGVDDTSVYWIDQNDGGRLMKTPK
jgi:hypothetical protein